MANEKKTIKTKLVQVGTEKIDMPYTLDQFVITTDGKTVKELLDELDVEIGVPKDVDNNIDATGLYKLIEDKTIDTSTLQLKEDNTLNTDDKTIVGGINELDTAIGDIKTEIGTKKVEGTPEVLEHYELSDSSNPDALEVVDDSVTPADGQMECHYYLG